MLDKSAIRKLFSDYGFNKKACDSHLSNSNDITYDYIGDNIEEKIKEWVANDKHYPEDDFRRVSHEFGANSFFMWLMTD